jgi:phage terminase large subunit GpA-like protein
MSIEHMSSYIKVAQSISPLSIGTASGENASATETAVDGRGFSRVLHILNVGTMGDKNILASVWESATSSGTYTKVASTNTTISTNAGASEVYLWEVPVNVAKPYQKLLTTAGSGFAEIGGVAILFGGSRTLPPTQENTVITV